MKRLVGLEPEILKRSGGIFLEIGAGTGPLTRALEEGVPLSFRKLHVSDISPEMLSEPKAEQGEPGDQCRQYLCCNVLKTPFPDSSIDLLIGMDILHHILNYPLALRSGAGPSSGGVCVLKRPHRDAYPLPGFLSEFF